MLVIGSDLRAAQPLCTRAFFYGALLTTAGCVPCEVRRTFLKFLHIVVFSGGMIRDAWLNCSGCLGDFPGRWAFSCVCHKQDCSSSRPPSTNQSPRPADFGSTASLPSDVCLLAPSGLPCHQSCPSRAPPPHDQSGPVLLPSAFLSGSALLLEETKHLRVSQVFPTYVPTPRPHPFSVPNCTFSL